MSTVEVIRVLLIDDHTLVRAGLRVLLTNQPTLHVVGEAAHWADAIALTAQEQPHVILLDTYLKTQPSIALLPELLQAAPMARIIMLATVHEPSVFYQAMQHGAVGVVLKDQTPEMLHKAIQKVHLGEVWLDRTMMAHVLTVSRKGNRNDLHNPNVERIISLTDRERQVIALIGQGFKNKQIAQQLSITETTVRHHLTSIFNKLCVTNRLELMRYAYQHNLTEAPYRLDS